MVTTGEVAEDVRHVKGVAKKTQTAFRKITQKQLNAQTINKTISLSEGLMIFIKEWEVLGVK